MQPTTEHTESPRGRHRRGCRYPIPRTVYVVRVLDDPEDPDRVIVTDRAGNVASMTVIAYRLTCRLAPRAEVDSVRIL